MSLDSEAPGPRADEGAPAPAARGSREARAVGRSAMRRGSRVELLTLQVSPDGRSLRLGVNGRGDLGRVFDPPTRASPFVTVDWDDGTQSTLLRWNVRVVPDERET